MTVIAISSDSSSRKIASSAARSITRAMSPPSPRPVGTARSVGADVSKVALDRARTRLPDAELVLLEPDEALPFADNEFDLVTCIETLEHVRDVQLALSEIRRVLRPGGRLALTTPASARW